MEHCFSKNLQDRTNGSDKNEVTESVRAQLHMIHDLKEEQGSQEDDPQISGADMKVVKDVREEVAPAYTDAPGEVNMEASISAEDVIRAGGFGARDDISSFLPVASDSTDFEASLLDARDYEEPQQEIKRPGLGWTEAKN